MSILKSFSDEEFTAIINKSNTLGEVMSHLGYKSKNSANTRKSIRNRAHKLGLSTDKFNNLSSAKGREIHSDEVYYTKGVYRGSNLAVRFKKLGHIPYQCQCCGNTGQWMGKSLVLQLDHIDGDNTNNELDNLRWLCPNCHSQTPTFGNTNRSSRKKRTREKNTHAVCLHCGKEFTARFKDTKYCSRLCYDESHKL